MDIPVKDLRPHNMLLLEHNDAPSLCRWGTLPLCVKCQHVSVT